MSNFFKANAIGHAHGMKNWERFALNMSMDEEDSRSASVKRQIIEDAKCGKRIISIGNAVESKGIMEVFDSWVRNKKDEAFLVDEFGNITVSFITIKNFRYEGPVFNPVILGFDLVIDIDGKRKSIPMQCDGYREEPIEDF